MATLLIDDLIDLTSTKTTNKLIGAFPNNTSRKRATPIIYPANDITLSHVATVTTSQPNYTNKSEYAFENTLNNDRQKTISLVTVKGPQPISADDLQSLKESETQSGIVTSNSITNPTNDTINTEMNINELLVLFSHIYDNDNNLMQLCLVIANNNTVNIKCDFNYLKNSNVSVNDDQNYLIDNNVKQQQPTTIDQLIACQRREALIARTRNIRALRLCGGGEGSLSAGASGWGSPPNQQNPNAGQWGSQQSAPQQQNWNAQQQQPPTAQQQIQPSGAAQQQPMQQQNPNAGNQPIKPQAPPGVAPPQQNWAAASQQQQNSANPINQPPPNPNGQNPPVAGIVGGGTSAVAAKNQLEHLNSMRESLFAQDGWGCQNVNQDTNWDIPGSPEPGPRNDPSGTPIPTAWKPCTANNGTELWEANLRNGGQPPPQPVQKAPWGHTPTTNLGGTWGEDDDGNDNNNVWTGGSQGNAPSVAGGPNWQGQNPQGGITGGATGGNGIWPNATPNVGANANIPKKENEWGGAGVSAGGGGNNNWGDPRDTRPSNAPIDMRNIDPRDPRAAGVDMRMMDPRENIHGNVRGVTGRLNGPSDMWNAGMGGPGQMPMNKIVGPGASAGAGNNPQWPGGQMGGPKDLGGMNKPIAGWEEPSPPASRRGIPPNFDDGTSFWNAGGPQPGRGVGPDANWKNADPMARNNLMARNPGAAQPGAGGPLPPNRLPNAAIKQDPSMWGHPGARNTSWDDSHNPNWGGNSDDKGITPWTDPSSSGSSWNKPNKQENWNSDISNDWSQASKVGNANSEIIRSSKQFRILSDMKFMKDDIELALRATSMNMDEAVEMLNQQQQRNSAGGLDSWPPRRHDDHSQGGGFDHPGGAGFPNRYPGGPQFPPNNNAKLPNNMTTLNNLPMQPQQQLNKHLSHPGTPNSFGNQTPAGQASGQQPSNQQLRMLVQQIQMAVQAGYLNHQILNQPLAPQTLVLLNQLLQHIKQLQMTQTSITRNGGVNNIQLQMTIQKQKLQISTLQQQIAQKQAIYINSQATGNSTHLGGNTGNDFLRQNSAGGPNHDPISALQNNFNEMGLNKEQTPGYQPSNNNSQLTSRLNQWKLPSLDKPNVGGPGDPVDFSRAPGTTAKPATTPTNIGALGIHSDGSPWSSGRNVGDGWPDSNNDSENKDWPTSQQSPAAFTDLVPEFEPGKPWKGTQMKNVEDDPSITPGSVARNPLSISAAKESDLFGNSSKTSPSEISLSSSTWSFNPSSTQQAFSKMGGSSSKTNSWSDSTSTSDLWGIPNIGKTPGPPPGMGAKNGSSGAATSDSTSSDWMAGFGGSNYPNSAPNSAGISANAGNFHSTWLLLKNLTAQIDGSTLRTLCVQHGPLQHFHLYLNHGIALCKYSSREEASKAQTALNNCVLGNTTICAEAPTESEVQNILQHLGVPAGSTGNGSNSGGNGGNGATTASSTWRPPSQQGPARQPSAGSDTWGSEWSAVNPSNW